MQKILLFLIFLLVSGLVVFFALNKNKENYAIVEEKEIINMVYGSGYARSKDYVLVKSEVSGYVKEIFVKEGDYVKKGKVLALIDSGSLDESIREVSERLNLVRERSREGSAYLKSLEKAMESARINMENSKSLFERRERLFSQGLIPREAYEQSKAQYEMAQREYEKAKSLYEDALKSIRGEENILKAQLRRLLKERERYKIVSPIDGYILKKFVNVGDYINHMSQENRLFSIGSKDFEVLLEVDEEYVGLIKKGQRVILKVDAFPKETFEGKVREVIREVERSRKLITVKVDVELPEETPSGATVDGQIYVERKRVLLIPARAYRDGYVLRYDGVRRIEVPVKVGERYGEFLEVIEGLKAGDKVILP